MNPCCDTCDMSATSAPVCANSLCECHRPKAPHGVEVAVVKEDQSNEWRDRFIDFYFERGSYAKRPLGPDQYIAFIEYEINKAKGDVYNNGLITGNEVGRAALLAEVLAELPKTIPDFADKPYDGNDLKSASDYYHISASDWIEIIRFEDGKNEALSQVRALLESKLDRLG